MEPIEREGEVQVELFVRNELPPPARERADAIAARLDELAGAGVIDEVYRRSWEKRVPIETCSGETRDAYLAFSRWAADAGVRLQPFFQTREHYSKTHGERTDWLVLPAICLVVHEDDRLSAVYPHSDGRDAKTVEDGLDQFRPEGPEATETSSAMAD